MRKNKNKSYKYDILLRKENKSVFLREKKYKRIEFFSEKEKEDLKKILEPLASEVFEKINKLSTKEEMGISDPEMISFLNLVYSNMDVYIHLAKSFILYNKKWDLCNFSQNDFHLFLLFSDLQIYFKEDISLLYIDELGPKYEDLKAKVISNSNLNLIEKVRIISGFSKFVSSQFLKNYSFPEFFIIQDLKENDPYKITKEKYEAIIKELKEFSGYFKKLLLHYKGSINIINLWDFKDIEITNSKHYSNIDKTLYFKYNSEDLQKEINKKNEEDDNKDDKKGNKKNNEDYGNKEIKNINEQKNNKIDNDKENKELKELAFPMLSMITLNQVKENLMKLLPKFFFKVNRIYSFNTLSDRVNRITLFNENKIFNLNDVKKGVELDPNECILPLLIEFAYEPFSYLKINFSNISSISPLLSPINSINKFLYVKDHILQSGYLKEYFLTDNYGEFKFLRYRNINLFPLTDSKYWTDTNFNKMREFNKKVMKTMKVNFNQENIHRYNFGKESNDDDDDENLRCYFKKYNSLI